MLNDKLRVGVIQTSLNHLNAWDPAASWPGALQISSVEEIRARREIRHLLSSLHGAERHADFILLPELSVPLGYEKKLRKAAEKLESIVIAGMDYKVLSNSPKTVSNSAVIIVPKKLSGRKIASHTSVRYIGKTFAAPQEDKKLRNLGVSFKPDPAVWLFSDEKLGNFGVAVCYDFMDLDRIVLYCKLIQTLFVLAYNRDTTTFHHVAETIARTVFCNVVVCNCGFCGDSLAVSPFIKPYDRTIYRHTGQHLDNSQLIELPLESLRKHQTQEERSDKLKNLPPGFNSDIEVFPKEEVL